MTEVWSQAQADFYYGKITIDELVANLESAQCRVDAAEKKNAALKQQLEQQKKPFEGPNDELVTNLESCHHRVEVAEKENTILKQRVDEMEDAILKQQQEENDEPTQVTSPLPLSATNLEIQNLRTQIIDLEWRLEESKKETEEIMHLGEEISDGQNGQIKELEESNERLKTELASLKRGSESTNYHEQEKSTSGKEVVRRQNRPEDRIEQGKDQEIAALKYRVLNLDSRAHDAENEVEKQIQDIDRLESEIEDLKDQLDLCHKRIGQPSDGGNHFPSFDPQNSGYRSPDPDGLFGAGINREQNNPFGAPSGFGRPSSSSDWFEDASGGFGGAPDSGRPPPSSGSLFADPAPGGQRYNSPFGGRSASPSGGFGTAAPRPSGLGASFDSYNGGSVSGHSNNNDQRYDLFDEQHGHSGRVWTITDSEPDTRSSLSSREKNDQKRPSRFFGPFRPPGTKSAPSLDQAHEMKERIRDVQARIVIWSEKYSSLKILNEGLAHQGGGDILDLVKDFVVLKDGKLPFDPNDKAFDGQTCTMLLQGFTSHRLFSQILVKPESGKEPDKEQALKTARSTAERVVRMSEWHFIEETDRDDAIRDLTVIACDVAKIAFGAWSSQTKFDIYSLKRSIDELRSQLFSLTDNLRSHDLHTSELTENPQALDKMALLIVVSPIVGVVGKVSFVVKGIVYLSKQLDAI